MILIKQVFFLNRLTQQENVYWALIALKILYSTLRKLSKQVWQFKGNLYENHLR